MPRSRSSSPAHSPQRSRSPVAAKTWSLLVRQLPFKVKPEEVKQHFEQFGPVKDVYLPVDYYTRRPRGFGFVEFEQEKDAREAMDRTDGQEVLGSTLKVVMAREGRKAPTDMKRREDHYRRHRSRSGDRRRRKSRSPRHKRRSRSRSRSSSSDSHRRSRSPPRRRRHSGSSHGRSPSSKD